MRSFFPFSRSGFVTALLLVFVQNAISQESQEHPLFNLQLGARFMGMSMSSSELDQKISTGHYSILPKLGYYLLPRTEIGLSANIAFQRGSSHTNTEEGNGLALGYYSRYNFSQLNLLNFLVKENLKKGQLFPFIEWEHRLGNMTYRADQFSKTGFSESFSTHVFLPKAGLKIGADNIFFSGSAVYNFSPGYAMPARDAWHFLLSFEYLITSSKQDV